MPPEALEIQRWLLKAQTDWTVARKAIQPPPQLDAAAFHCQQAVEKLLKAYLIAHNVAFEKVHDLSRLVQQCAVVDPDFASLAELVEPLTLYAVAYRYPGPADPTRARVEAALEVVAHVWEYVVARLPPDLAPPSPEP
ncbi:MAG: HEPN domain-containing protein [Planctomycetota bacterium]